jgi:hypothetical protein
MASFCGVSLRDQRSWLGGLYYLEGDAMTQDEIQTAILQVCKVSGNDSDFNVLGFYTLCDRLVELGAAAERKPLMTDEEYEQAMADEGQRRMLEIDTEVRTMIKEAVDAEREACAKVCDEMVLYTGFDCAAAIRARGNDAA